VLPFPPPSLPPSLPLSLTPLPGIELPRERIYGLGSGPKTDILARMARLNRERAAQDPSMDREPTVREGGGAGKREEGRKGGRGRV